MGDASKPDRPQSDKFKDLAREVEADEDEAAFDEKLRKMRRYNSMERGDEAKKNR